MIVINDFFARRKEAVSNQMELIAKDNDCKIIAATRFMNQKALQKEDIRDKIYIYSPFVYPLMLIKHVIKSKGIIHLFEEEPSIFKRALFNITKRNLYVSLYRLPSKKEYAHLKKFKYLKGIFVELPLHRDLLIEHGFSEDMIHLTPTPTKFNRTHNKHKYDPRNIKILFASWNMAEGDPLYDRGLIYLLDMLGKNKYLHLTVILRDNNTAAFVNEFNKRNLFNRVQLVDVNSDDELEQVFENVDFVAFPAQKRIVKDVPNSLIDGLCKGKPVILTDILNFSKIVKDKKIGIVVKVGEPAINLDLSYKEYETLSNNAFNYSKIHSKDNYVGIIKKVYKNDIR